MVSGRIVHMVCGAEFFLISINADFIFHMISLHTHTHTHKNNKQKENKEGFIFNINYRLKLSKKVKAKWSKILDRRNGIQGIGSDVFGSSDKQ